MNTTTDRSQISAVLCNKCNGIVMASIIPVPESSRKEQARLLKKYDVRIEVVPTEATRGNWCRCDD